MKRTTVSPSPFNGIHVGIIMDGNGRWASARGLPRTAGHRAGVRTARQIVAHLPGGDLNLHWSEQDNHVYMTGPAVEVFSGEWPE